MRDTLAPSLPCLQVYIMGPFRETTANESIFLCPVCDKAEQYPEFLREIEEALAPPVTPVCCVEWLEGRELFATKVKGIPSNTSACAWEDPYPGIPEKLPKHKRFFYYKMTALALGIREERRVRHPPCVADHVAHTFPDESGSPTKVGYRQRD